MAFSTLEALQSRDREVVVALADGGPKAAIAGRLGLSRPALYRSMERIRSVFRSAGLEEYLR